MEQVVKTIDIYSLEMQCNTVGIEFSSNSESFGERPILLKFKEDENFNRRNT
jgi:hypothetical protein